MDNVTSEIRNGELLLSLCGRLDSSNAAAVGEKIDSLLKDGSFSSVTLNLEKLTYISSAGLRVFLHIRKAQPNTCAVNASSEVFDILDMTGFTELFPVKKAYRHVSVDGCAKIGTGATGDVYRLDADIIVKVYHDPDALPDIHRERELARKAFILGIPTAIPFDVVRVGDKFGSVFELLQAKSFAERIIECPQDLDKYIDLSVDLMRKIHATEVKEADLPAAKDKALAVAEYLSAHLTADKALKFRKMADAIPDTMHMIHGDLHIKNMMIQNGELLLIDMDTLCHGHPLFELEALFEAYIGYSELDKNNTLSFFGIPFETAERLWKETLRRYLGIREDSDAEAVENKIKLLGYASLYRYFTLHDENPTGLKKLQIDAYKNHILTLLEKVDSFDFCVPAYSGSAGSMFSPL